MTTQIDVPIYQRKGNEIVTFSDVFVNEAFDTLFRRKLYTPMNHESFVRMVVGVYYDISETSKPPSLTDIVEILGDINRETIKGVFEDFNCHENVIDSAEYYYVKEVAPNMPMWVEEILMSIHLPYYGRSVHSEDIEMFAPDIQQTNIWRWWA